MALYLQRLRALLRTLRNLRVITQTSATLADAGATPHEALLTAEQNRGKIDFLVADVIMPKMNGRELAIQLTPKLPSIEVLYVSGYTNSLAKDGLHGVLEEEPMFLQKPFARRALTQKSRLILDSSQTEPVTSFMDPI